MKVLLAQLVFKVKLELQELLVLMARLAQRELLVDKVAQVQPELLELMAQQEQRAFKVNLAPQVLLD
jgi:hypothetical protein